MSKKKTFERHCKHKKALNSLKTMTVHHDVFLSMEFIATIYRWNLNDYGLLHLEGKVDLGPGGAAEVRNATSEQSKGTECHHLVSQSVIGKRPNGETKSSQ